MIVKIHKREGKTIVAVCDDNLSGKRIEEGDLQLDLTSDFYSGEERSGVEAGDIMRNADVVNLVGEEAVKIGIEEGIIEKSNIIYVAGIPHAQASVNHSE